MNDNKYVFLFGHRQQHGKNTAVALLERHLAGSGKWFISTYFAKKLKKMCAEKYRLDFSKMEDNDYKSSSPPHLAPRSIRQVLIDEGCSSRNIWVHTWAHLAYSELYNNGEMPTVGIVSDFRYPNEYDYGMKFIEDNKISNVKIVKVLVHRPDGIMKSDGADNLLPDDDKKYWDHVIINNSTPTWKEEMYTNIVNIMRTYGL